MGFMAIPPGSRTGFLPAMAGASVFHETMTPVSPAPLAYLRCGLSARYRGVMD
jgi:hypothetical protein